MDEKQFKELIQEINILIGLQTATLIKDKTLRESIMILDKAGLGATKIAQILKKKPKYVSKELALIRKKR